MLRLSKFTFMEKRAQKWENYKYTFNRRGKHDAARGPCDGRWRQNLRHILCRSFGWHEALSRKADVITPIWPRHAFWQTMISRRLQWHEKGCAPASCDRDKWEAAMSVRQKSGCNHHRYQMQMISHPLSTISWPPQMVLQPTDHTFSTWAFPAPAICLHLLYAEAGWTDFPQRRPQSAPENSCMTASRIPWMMTPHRMTEWISRSFCGSWCDVYVILITLCRKFIELSVDLLS